jgi:hypothetical protein
MVRRRSIPGGALAVVEERSLLMSATETAEAELTEITEAYLRAWNSDDLAERGALLERTVADDVIFVDPMAHITGRDALADHITAVRAQFPGVMFAPAGDVDAHNSVLRVPWTAALDGAVALRGLDVDDVGADGRLTRIVGFFDKQ